MEEGKNIWLFPDGELPEQDKGSPYQAHEALIILNTSDKKAKIKMDVYFSDKNPIEGIDLEVNPKRVKCFRLDKPEEIQEVKIPRHVQYALRIESNTKVVATFGRLDTSSEKLAYYVGAAFSY